MRNYFLKLISASSWHFQFLNMSVLDRLRKKKCGQCHGASVLHQAELRAAPGQRLRKANMTERSRGCPGVSGAGAVVSLWKRCTGSPFRVDEKLLD